MDFFLHITHHPMRFLGGSVPHQCAQTDRSLCIRDAGCENHVAVPAQDALIQLY